jgi:hypothetical protein
MNTNFPTVTLAIVCASLLCTRSVSGDDLQRDFLSPPESTKPGCYWYWLDGHYSKEGLTKDLEQMQEIGIGRAYIGLITFMSRLPLNAELKPWSDEWWSHIEHGVREAGRLGIDIGLFNSPGWSMSGGPWVEPAQAMRYLVKTELQLKGPQTFSGPLAVPGDSADFQDVAVLAYPAPSAGEEIVVQSNASVEMIAMEADQPFTARGLVIQPAKAVNHVEVEFQASDDGKTFRSIKTFEVKRSLLNANVGPLPLAPVSVSFPATTARHFRLVLKKPSELGEIGLLSAPVVEDFAGKALLKMFQGSKPPFSFYVWPDQDELDDPSLAIEPKDVINLSKKMDASGTLTWDVPPGEWIVARFGTLPTGVKNAPACKDTTGLEIDKMSKEAVRHHFDSYAGKLLERLPEQDRKALKFLVADSYEVGPQNWTDGFAAEFEKTYGYDPLPFLPAIYGTVVGSAEQSNRFLWDLRRFVADRIATEYVAGLREVAQENGMKVWLENFGHWGFSGEFLNYGGQSEEIGAEFWIDDGDNKGIIEVPAAASAAHTYGKPVVWAEAFTSPRQTYEHSPRDFKKLGDWAYANGINQYILHVNIHQPWEDRLPGINASFGSAFNRHNTWYGMAKSWIDYQRRSSVLLQHGTHVADVAYYIGEDTPKMAGLQSPPLPAGYASDFINAEVLLTRAEVKDQKLVLPDGKSYRLLVLPPSDTMRPEVLERIAGFVEAGLPVIGPLPKRSPSLENYPASDRRVRELAAKLEGRVLSGKDLKQALASVPPDVSALDPKQTLFLHRQSSDTDIYFLSNQTDKPQAITPVFRAQRPIVELWYADLGKIQSITAESVGSGTKVPMTLEPHGSIFVVLRDKPSPEAVKAVAEKAENLQPIQEITGPWNVTFDPKAGGPQNVIAFDTLKDWSKDSDPSVQFFAGTATYRKEFTFDATKRHAPDGRVVLDLGQVEEIAEVTLNGETFPELWKPPYRVDVTDAVRQGSNTLEIKVANTWWNRIVGAKRGIKGIEGPEPFVSNFSDKLFERHLSAESELLPAGLLGPVRLVTP